MQHKTIIEFEKKAEAYRDFLIDFEKKIKNKKHYDKSLQMMFNNFTNRILSVAYNFESKIPFFSRKKARQLFRKFTGRYFYKSKMIKRFYDKPRGYPGDYLMFEMLYKRKPISKGLGYYVDTHVFGRKLSKAAIGRKDLMKQFLIDAINKTHKPIKILNIGCGSAREIRELFEKNEFNHDVNLVLLDQDEAALKSAHNTLKNYKGKICIKILKKDILNLVGFGKNIQELKSQNFDLIYSLGVVDYFLDNVLERFISICYSLLKPGGRLIFASCSPRNPLDYAYLRWFSEWIFFTRHTNSIKRIVRNKLGISPVKFVWEENNQIYLVIISK